MESVTHTRFVDFLCNDLALPNSDVTFALRHCEQNAGSLPIILWQYGLVTLEQLDQIFDWLETI